MKSLNIKCDYCGKDLSPSDHAYPHQYIIRIMAVDVKDTSIQTTRGVYAVYMAPPLKRDLDFCNVKCVSSYLTEKHNV